MANLMWRLGNGGMPTAQAYVLQIGAFRGLCNRRDGSCFLLASLAAVVQSQACWCVQTCLLSGSVCV